MNHKIAVAGMVFLLAIGAVGSAWRGHSNRPLTFSAQIAAAAETSHAEPSGQTPLYYQDPDGKPFYAAGPKKTASGRDYVPIYADAASPPAQAAPAKPGASSGRGLILYYRVFPESAMFSHLP